MNRVEQTLALIKQYSVASTSQLATLIANGGREPRHTLVRRWIATLVKRGQIRIGAARGNRGRPQLLAIWGRHNGHAVEHHFQVTEFAVELLRAGCACPGISCLIKPISFGDLVPDLAFVLTRAKPTTHCQFFLEYDRGTEPLVRSGHGSDIEEKLRRYLEIRINGRYREAAPDLNCHGFRVLIVASSEARFRALCRLAQSAPGDFVWVTSLQRIMGDLTSDVWSRRGPTAVPASIFRSSTAIRSSAGGE